MNDGIIRTSNENEKIVLKLVNEVINVLEKDKHSIHDTDFLKDIFISIDNYITTNIKNISGLFLTHVSSNLTKCANENHFITAGINGYNPNEFTYDQLNTCYFRKEWYTKCNAIIINGIYLKNKKKESFFKRLLKRILFMK